MNHRDIDGFINMMQVGREIYHFERGHKTRNLYLIRWSHSRRVWQIPEIGHECSTWRGAIAAIWLTDAKTDAERHADRVNAIDAANDMNALRIKAGTFGQLDIDSNHKRVFAQSCEIGRESHIPSAASPENNAIFDKMRADQLKRSALWLSTRINTPETPRFWDNSSENAYYEAKNE